jgi:prepilin-type N-terminal cleavage/methylation domain-containing protein/prepilin-type processing-associated H-X9-DG protein
VIVAIATVGGESMRDHTCARSPDPRGRRGFTLVELLVVVGIIVGLIAILLPALSRARSYAATVQCLSNLRQIGMAEAMYTVDNHGFWVPLNYQSGAQAGVTWAGLLVECNYLTVPYTNNNTYVIQRPSVFQCPEGLTDMYSSFNASTPTTSTDNTLNRPQCTGFYVPGPTAPTVQYFSYWYGTNGSTASPNENAAYNIFPTWVIPPQNNDSPPPTDLGTDWPKLQLIHRAYQLVDHFDGIADYNLYNAYRISPRHNRNNQTNVLFWDGHAMTVPYKYLPGPKPSIGTQTWSGAALDKLCNTIIWTTTQMNEH